MDFITDNHINFLCGNAHACKCKSFMRVSDCWCPFWLSSKACVPQSSLTNDSDWFKCQRCIGYGDMRSLEDTGHNIWIDADSVNHDTGFPYKWERYNHMKYVMWEWYSRYLYRVNWSVACHLCWNWRVGVVDPSPSLPCEVLHYEKTWK